MVVAGVAFTLIVTSSKQEVTPSVIVALYVVVVVGDTDKVYGEDVELPTTVPPAVRLVIVMVVGFLVIILTLSIPQLSSDPVVDSLCVHLNFVFQKSQFLNILLKLN